MTARSSRARLSRSSGGHDVEGEPTIRYTSDSINPPRRYACECGAYVLLGRRDPLPPGWTVTAHGSRVTGYWCPACARPFTDYRLSLEPAGAGPGQPGAGRPRRGS